MARPPLGLSRMVLVTLPAPVPTRHPLDPEPAPATKARAVFVLGLVGMITGAFVGGVIPATIALLLAREVEREQWASGGYLLGSRWVRRGRVLAWIGLVLAMAALVVACIAGLLHLASTPGGVDFSPGTD
jgi:(hydroxyamino)benzene mutase